MEPKNINESEQNDNRLEEDYQGSVMIIMMLMPIMMKMVVKMTMMMIEDFSLLNMFSSY